MNPMQGVLIVVEAAVASVLLPPMAWLLARTYRRSAAGRRLVWVTVFVMLLALPLLALVAPSAAVVALPVPAAPALAPPPEPVITPAPTGFFWPAALIPLAAAVWLAGLARLAVQNLVTLVRLELMRRGAQPWTGPLPVAVRGCELLMSEDCPGPMTWGAFRPVIMLPDEALDWPQARLEAALRHELAHVVRRDGLVQALSMAACALYWPNPLVWLAARALRREAELAADDTVIASGVRPSDYAGQLVALAAEWRERRLTPTGLAMAAPPALSQRVQSILSTDAIRTGATAMDTFKLVVLGGAATAALTLARPSVAEVPAPASSPAPQAQALQPSPAPRPGVQFAQQDVPAPPASPAVAAKPLPPLPASPPSAALDAPPAPPALAPLPPGPPGAVMVGGSFKGKNFSFTAMTPEQSAELAKIGPAVNKAIADAHIDETVQKALAAQDAKTREEVAKQLQQIGPLIQQAIANAHIQEQVQQRLSQLGPEIQEALKKAPPLLNLSTTTSIPYNAVTDDPASPGYIAPGQPGAQHPVPAQLAILLNARKAKDGTPGTNQPWILSWLPAGAPTPAAGAPGANPPAWLPNPSGPQPAQAPQPPKN